MCNEFHHVHTFSNRVAFIEVCKKICKNPEYDSTFPYGVFYVPYFMLFELSEDWDEYSFAILMAHLNDKNIKASKYEFNSWEGFFKAINLIKDKQFMFGKITLDMM